MHACTNVVTDKTKGKKKRIYEKMKKEKKIESNKNQSSNMQVCASVCQRKEGSRVWKEREQKQGMQ